MYVNSSILSDLRLIELTHAEGISTISAAPNNLEVCDMAWVHDRVAARIWTANAYIESINTLIDNHKLEQH